MAGQDLTPLLLDALGKRIDDPVAITLAAALGKTPFKSATPNKSHAIADRKRGLEVASGMMIRNRDYWPYRKEGRVWVTWVSHAFVYPNYRGSLPAGLDWQMDELALRARFTRRVEGVLRDIRFTLPPPRDGLSASVELNGDGRPRHLLLAIAQERDYATIHPGSQSEHNIENGFRQQNDGCDQDQTQPAEPRSTIARCQGQRDRQRNGHVPILDDTDAEPEPPREPSHDRSPFCQSSTRRKMMMNRPRGSA